MIPFPKLEIVPPIVLNVVLAVAFIPARVIELLEPPAVVVVF